MKPPTQREAVFSFLRSSLFSARLLDAPGGYRIGLVNRVRLPDELETATFAYAHQLSIHSQNAIHVPVLGLQ